MTGIDSSIRDFRKSNTANSTAASFTALVATVTDPTGTGVVDWTTRTEQGVEQGPNTVLVMPFGVGNADTHFVMRVTAWNKIESLWIPTRLAEITCTLGTAVGVASNPVNSTDKFCDTLVEVLIPDSGQIWSPADNSQGWFMLDAIGADKLQFTFNMDSSATSANALFRGL